MKLLAIVLVLSAVIWTTAVSYRSYRVQTELQLAERRAAFEQREAELQRRDHAKEEAERLALAQIEQEAAAAAAAAAELRSAQEQAAAAQAGREKDAARWAVELERLRHEKESVMREAEQLSEQRREELARIEEARAAALARLGAIETEQVESRDRAAALAEALERQAAIEKKAQDALARLRKSLERH